MNLKSRKSEYGQGMVEYIIIVALIALAAIAAFSYFGGAVRGQTVQMAAQVAGTDSTAGGDGARKAANDAASKEAGKDVDLSNYQEHDNNK